MEVVKGCVVRVSSTLNTFGRKIVATGGHSEREFVREIVGDTGYPCHNYY
jgi:hypothetical protein